MYNKLRQTHGSSCNTDLIVCYLLMQYRSDCVWPPYAIQIWLYVTCWIFLLLGLKQPMVEDSLVALPLVSAGSVNLENCSGASVSSWYVKLCRIHTQFSTDCMKKTWHRLATTCSHLYMSKHYNLKQLTEKCLCLKNSSNEHSIAWYPEILG